MMIRKQFKVLCMLAATIVLVLAMSTNAFAFVRGAGLRQDNCPMWHMFDADGSIIPRDTFEDLLDEFIADGRALEADRDFFLERFDFLSEHGVDFRFCGQNLSHHNRRMGRQHHRTPVPRGLGLCPLCPR